MKKVMKAGVISAIAFCASMANASVVSFEQDSYGPAASFVDGTFSSNLSGRYPDGFYSYAYFASRTYALNGHDREVLHGLRRSADFPSAPYEPNMKIVSSIPLEWI